MRALSTQKLIVAILLLSIFTMAARAIVDPDFFWHLSTGRLIWETGKIPKEDPFSYTIPHRPWVTHEWLSEVIFFGIYRLTGEDGLILAFAGIVTLGFALVYVRCEGKPYLAAFLVLLAALASAVTWGVRPQMFSLLLCAVFLYVLNHHKEGKGRLWTLVPLMTLWVNLHGGYFLGLALISIYLLGEVIETLTSPPPERAARFSRLRQLFIVLLLSLGATVINPNGLHILLYPFGTLSSAAMQAYIQEWFSPDFHQAHFQPLALFLLLVVLTYALSPRRPGPTEMLLTLLLGYASLRSARNIPFFSVAVAPILSQHLAETLKRWLPAPSKPSPRFAILNWLLLGLTLLVGSLKVVGTLNSNSVFQSERFPVKAADYLQRENLSGRIYNLYDWGGYLIWRLYPGEQVFIDGRADVYGDAFIEEYLKVYRLEEDWEKPLAKYGVTLILIDARSSLATALKGHPQWKLVYSDELAAVFTKDG